MPDHLWQIFAEQVARRQTADALITRNESLTWKQLADAVPDVHTYLAFNHDANDESRFVVHECENRLADVLIWLACLRGGLVDVPIDARLPSETKQSLLSRFGDSHLSPSQLQRIERSVGATASDRLPINASPSGPSDDALVLWTSGTTDSPKGVVLGNRALAVNATAKLKAVPQTADDVRLTVLPICHAYARTCDMGTWLLSGCTLAMGLGMAGWIRLAGHVRPTLANVVPSLAKRLLLDETEGNGACSLRLLGCGGAGLDEGTFEAWRRRGVTVIQGYGLTETGPVICSATPNDAMPCSVGRVVDGWETKLVDGSLHVRGPALMNGYLGETRRSPEDWFDTGDRVEISADTGQFRILGRNDDVITLSNGYQVHPALVEQALLRCPTVSQSFVALHNDQLTAWIDPYNDRNVDQCNDQLQQLPRGQRPQRIVAMALTTEQIADCKTAKGTLRRDAMRSQLNVAQ